MNTQNGIRVLVGKSLQSVDDGQCDEVRECDTMREAMQFARYALTPSYQRTNEMSSPVGYVRVMRDDTCENDFFAKPAKKVKITATKRVRELLVDLDKASGEFDAAVSVMAHRGTSDTVAADAGITKLQAERKILVIAWHINLASRGLQPGDSVSPEDRRNTV